MKLKLSKYWTEYLLKYPETGMGYQKVDVILKSGQIIKDVVILNAEDLMIPEKYENLKLEEITNFIVQGTEKDKT